MLSEADAALETAKKGIEVADKSIDLYNKVIDQVIPWKTFEDTIAELTKYRDHYSSEASQLVGQVKTLLLNSQDEYHSSTQTIFEWCSLVSTLMSTYLTLFENIEEAKAEAQKKILLKVFDEGLEALTESQQKLEAASKSFNDAAGKIIVLNHQLDEDFSENSSYFNSQVDKIRKEAYAGAATGLIGGPFGLLISYAIASGVVEGKLIPELKNKFAEVQKFYYRIQTLLNNSTKNIEDAKSKLLLEIESMGEIKSTTKTTKIYLEFSETLRTQLIDSAAKLINQCTNYMARHRGA